ncbi:MAG: sn-glycerol-3-phosphate ABC transporter ATP-binding protein UgpC [Ignavibacteriales bacterium]|nr:sn-glycerol-3-phosphate ABC transporter ATP-binding protein UgpC [Ignavibacteriales bacterium]
MGSVRLEGVYKKYENNIVVQDVNLNIADKEFVVLVGPSGCGKSTTLRMIAGLEEISEGKIFIDSALVNDVPPKNRDIAMVFQNYALYPHMSVFENLAFGLKMRKFSKSEIENRVNQAAEILGIKEMLGRKPKALSGGQRQRVALGRAIVRKPKVFLFDEPLSNLDANLRVQMRTEISKLHKQIETTMIYVTHDQIEAMSMGDRIVVMNKGIIQQVDTPLNIYNHPSNRFVAGFIGSPTMNFFSGTLVRNNHLTFEDDTKQFNLEIEPGMNILTDKHNAEGIILGIRPEHIAAKPQNNFAKIITVNILVTEPVGNEIFIYFSLSNNGEQFVSRIPSEINPTAGTKFNLYIDTTKLHFFHPQTGISLKN